MLKMQEAQIIETYTHVNISPLPTGSTVAVQCKDKGTREQ